MHLRDSGLQGLGAGMLSHDDSTSLSETLDHNVEVAAVQNSLANMSMPQPRQESPAPESRLRSPHGQSACAFTAPAPPVCIPVWDV